MGLIEKRKCPICGIQYEADSVRLKVGRQTTCSKQCSYKLRAAAKYSKVELACKLCGKAVYRSKSQVYKNGNVFCSTDCKSAGQTKGLTAPMRKGTGTEDDKYTAYLKRKFYKYRATDRKRNVESIELSVGQFMVLLKNGSCFYCHHKSELGLDRVDNSKGHTIDNTVICCHLCNMTRGDRFSKEQMILIGKIIQGIRNEKAHDTTG